jgi:hypothetical protein
VHPIYLSFLQLLEPSKALEISRMKGTANKKLRDELILHYQRSCPGQWYTPRLGLPGSATHHSITTSSVPSGIVTLEVSESALRSAVTASPETTSFSSPKVFFHGWETQLWMEVFEQGSECLAKVSFHARFAAHSFAGFVTPCLLEVTIDHPRKNPSSIRTMQQLVIRGGSVQDSRIQLYTETVPTFPSRGTWAPFIKNGAVVLSAVVTLPG